MIVAVSEQALDLWIATKWPDPEDRPSWSRDFLRELFEDEQQRRAEEWAKSTAGKELDGLRRRVGRLERLLLDPSGKDLSAEMVDVLVEAVHIAGGEFFGKKIKALQERCAALEVELRERKGLAYEGVWTADRAYGAGSVVTHTGSAWITAHGTAAGERPGKSVGWKLMVKAGRDGRDVRPNGKEPVAS